MNTTRFCLVRHGETNWNVEGRLQGHTDVDLNERGITQAAQMAKAILSRRLISNLMCSTRAICSALLKLQML